MEIHYRRGLENSYMVISDLKMDGNRFDVSMLIRNRIEGVLPLEIKQMNETPLAYYDITGHQSLGQVYRKLQMKRGDLAGILEGILRVFRQSERYMLSTEYLLLDPEYVFLDRSGQTVDFCYFPWESDEGEQPQGRSFAGAQRLAEFFLKHLDHGDPLAVRMGYRFYQSVAEEGKGICQAAREGMEEGREEASPEEVPEFLRREASTSQPAVEKGMSVPEASLYGPEGPDRGFGREKESIARNCRETAFSGDHKEKLGEEKKGNRRDRQRSEKPGKGKTRKESRPKAARNNGREVPVIPVWYLILVLGAVCLNVGIDWYFSLDLTQIGGMAFGSIAFCWLIFLVFVERKRRDENPWEEYFPEADEAELPAEDILEWETYPDPLPEARPRTKNDGRFQPEDTTRVLEASPETEDFLLVGELMNTQPIRLQKGSWIIGKDSGQADIGIVSDAVSRVHAQLSVNGEELAVTDQNSRNGTFVNGKALAPNAPYLLHEGDRIRFADVRYMVQRG